MIDVQSPYKVEKERAMKPRSSALRGNRSRYALSLLVAALVPLCASQAAPPTGSSVSFRDIVGEQYSGLTYRRIASPGKDVWDDLRKQKELKGYSSAELFALFPPKPYGSPGIVIFDYDNDGDLDIFVTNGPGRPNSLFKNLLKETGKLMFKDVAEEVGLAMTAQDSSGACVGDIDNDGWMDLYVLVTGGPNHLFRNTGGRFVDITSTSNTGAGNHHATTCAFGDVNNDGLVDIAIANTWDNWLHRLPLASFNYLDHIEANQLLLNKNGLVFEDVSESSGIANFRGISWAIALVDMDQDGNLDIIVSDDQAMKRPTRWGGEDHGKLRYYKGDGKGHFVDLTDKAGATALSGDYMGTSFADFNHDGKMDVFSTNMGDYGARVQAVIPMVFWPEPSHHGELGSRWYFGNGDGKFTDPGVGDMGTSVFGWGVSAFDYDNDGCTDLVYYGALNLGIYYDASNPGALLHNTNCTGKFVWDERAMSKTNHSRRAVEGLATGDLDDDGFPDIVSVSGADWPEKYPLVPYPLGNLGGQFDQHAFIWPTFALIDNTDRSKGVRYTGMDPVEGTLSVELNSGNTNNWAKIRLIGGKGLTRDGAVNRAGIGALVAFTPEGGKTALRPYGGGGGYASNDSLETNFGMAIAKRARLDILWTGGTRNRLYDVKPGERLLIPEIPCDYFGNKIKSREALRACVTRALADYEKKNVVSKELSQRILASALRAYGDKNIAFHPPKQSPDNGRMKQAQAQR